MGLHKITHYDRHRTFEADSRHHSHGHQPKLKRTNPRAWSSQTSQAKRKLKPAA